ncbi:hypothetical protein [Capnocytophaga canimorsus]|uniref:hypothetical protein n=1 Tax=Capnocytophaga canimorsus TaxID=28188 RepID=UPI0037D50F2D
MATVANIDDGKAADFLMRTLAYLFIPLKIILADGGYRGEIIEQVKNKFGYIIQVVSCRVHIPRTKRNVSFR